MKICERCLARGATGVVVNFRKRDGANCQGRLMIAPEMVLCEQCITDLLKSFGRFKVDFLKEADESAPEPSASGGAS